jgi:hypothetical protein
MWREEDGLGLARGWGIHQNLLGVVDVVYGDAVGFGLGSLVEMV